MKTKWYISRAGKVSGPYSAADLKQFAAAGQLSPADLVQKAGMTDWHPAANVKGLFPQSDGVQQGPLPQPEASSASVPAGPANPFAFDEPGTGITRPYGPGGARKRRPAPPLGLRVAGWLAAVIVYVVYAVLTFGVLKIRLADSLGLLGSFIQILMGVALAGGAYQLITMAGRRDSVGLSSSRKRPFPWVPVILGALALIALTAGALFLARDRSGRGKEDSLAVADRNPELEVVEWYASDRYPGRGGILLVGKAARMEAPTFVVVKARLPGVKVNGQTKFYHIHRPSDFRLLSRTGVSYSSEELGDQAGNFGKELGIIGADGKRVPWESHMDGVVLFVVPRVVVESGGLKLQQRNKPSARLLDSNRRKT